MFLSKDQLQMSLLTGSGVFIGTIIRNLIVAQKPSKEAIVRSIVVVAITIALTIFFYKRIK